MRSRSSELLRSLVKRFRKNTSATTNVDSLSGPDTEQSSMTNPVDEYYYDKTRNSLPVFFRFAVQSRSIAIRDVFAKASSSEELDLEGLLNLVQNLPTALSEDHKRFLTCKFEVSILLALADLLANTARSDLDTYRAVQLYDFVCAISGISSFSRQQKLLYIEALSDARYFEQAELLARNLSIGELAPLQPELLALQRIRKQSPWTVQHWVQELNALYSALDMSKVRLLEDQTLPLLDRLTADGGDPVGGPKVSVIMPTFCPGQGIRTAVRGLLDQTWKNIEIIIVDDASPAEYQRVFTELAQLDSRIRVIHHEQNSGAYVARNTGLEKARGEFITTADDDDWSHPDKVVMQVSSLIEDDHSVACMSEHIRATEQLEFQRVNSAARFLQLNYSSLMLRKSVVDDIGGWDTVNRGADSEFLMRIRKYYGSERVAQIRARPLAFSRVWKGSLTSGEMYRGFTATPRLLHVWAIRQWHLELDEVGQKPVRPANSERPYSVPSTFEPGKRGKDLGLFDVIYVTDFYRQAKYVDFALKEMTTLVNKGLRVGYIHLDSPRTTKITGLPRHLLQLQFDGDITQVSLEDAAETRLLIVYDPAVGMFADQRKSRIRTWRSILVEKSLPTLSGAPERTPINYVKVLSHLDRTFDARFEVVGASEQDQNLVATHVPPQRLLENSMIWRTYVDENPSDIQPPSGKPIIGFHSYGNKYRWPRNKEVFCKVYLSDLFDTNLSGQLRPATKKFGPELLEAARLVDCRETPTEEFLRGIDFWVYYPEPRLQDQAWEPVLSAMKAGKVVILPPSLETVYQHGAVYGHPEDVEGLVRQLSSSRQDFEAQARLGQSFVNTLFSAERFYERISRILCTARGASEESVDEVL